MICPTCGQFVTGVAGSDHSPYVTLEPCGHAAAVDEGRLRAPGPQGEAPPTPCAQDLRG